MIDVIIPVHGGADATRRCIESVLAGGQRTPFETVVVDDATPVPEIARYLDGLASSARITLLRNERNLGFVQSVNRGMTLHADRDVVLLNSDTEVANDWLDRLQRAACNAPDIGTVTPWSNNATICSYPFEGWTDGVPGTLGLAALDRIFATVNDGESVDLPTAVGFCMYIRRACLDRVGLFDAERFGRGYGEENDFCLRASRAGWRSVLAGDVFVYHEGAVSFSDQRHALAQSATRTMLEIYPDYLLDVRAFIRRDSMRALREAVDVARQARGADEGSQVLAERADERARLAARLVEAETLAEEREVAIAQLRQALAKAEAVVADSATEFANLRDEITKLRAGLAHAETLVFDRQRQLEQLHSLPLWKLLVHRMRSK